MIRRLFFFPLDGGYVEHVSRNGKDPFPGDANVIDVTGHMYHEFAYLHKLWEINSCQFVHQAPALLQ